MPLIYVSRNAFYDVICVCHCIRFPAIINKSTQYDKTLKNEFIIRITVIELYVKFNHV